MEAALTPANISKNTPPNPSGIGRPRLRVRAASRRGIRGRTHRDGAYTRNRDGRATIFKTRSKRKTYIGTKPKQMKMAYQFVREVMEGEHDYIESDPPDQSDIITATE